MSTLVTDGSAEAEPRNGGMALWKQVALICRDPAFWKFLFEKHQYRCENELEAAAFVRKFCRGTVRSECLQVLGSQFATWMIDSQNRAA
jgi:hypothetical protein